MARSPVRALSLLALLPLLAPAGSAQDWPHWRGPSFDGSAVAQGLPSDFSKDKGVRWKAALPGPGAGTPVIHGERVFLPAIDEAGGALVALCFERASGELAWAHEAGSGYRPANAGSKTHLDELSDYASPSPVTDGERVLFFFGNGDLVAFSASGERLWERNLQVEHGDFAFQWTFSASPTLWGGRLFLQVLQRDVPVNGRGKDASPSFLLALEPESGKTIYRHVRPSSAVKESLESYATPIPYRGAGGREELLVVGGDVITGHDPSTGRELWRWGSWNEGHRQEWWRIVPSVVVGGGVALVCAPKGAPVFAVELGGEGALDDDALAWKSSGRRNAVTSDVPTPLFFEGSFFVLSDLGETLSRVDPASGAVAWTIELPGKHRWRASPTGADGVVFCMNHHGDVVIVSPKDGAILNRIAMGEEDDDQIRSSIAVAYDSLFVRTNTTLYCIGG